MSGFTFKQFHVEHDNSTMKVGTDAVLLGAWTEVGEGAKVLEIGCGCGVISMMLAQRFNCSVTAIDIDKSSVNEANMNFDKVDFECAPKALVADIREYTPCQRFDVVVSNPPFFSVTLLPPSQRRAAARNCQLLPFVDLIKHAVRLMSAKATFQVIIPTSEIEKFLVETNKNGLNMLRRTDVITKPGKLPKRSMLQFVNYSLDAPILYNDLILSNADGSRSDAYKELCREFYL
jgi:tRNA1Val (adenine37-N6)-methyltransferase